MHCRLLPASVVYELVFCSTTIEKILHYLKTKRQREGCIKGTITCSCYNVRSRVVFFVRSYCVNSFHGLVFSASTYWCQYKYVKFSWRSWYQVWSLVSKLYELPSRMMQVLWWNKARFQDNRWRISVYSILSCFLAIVWGSKFHRIEVWTEYSFYFFPFVTTRALLHLCNESPAYTGEGKLCETLLASPKQVLNRFGLHTGQTCTASWAQVPASGSGVWPNELLRRMAYFCQQAVQ